MSAHTDDDRKAVIDAINAHRSPTYAVGVVHDGPDCLADDILDAVTPAISAQALREAASALPGFDSIATHGDAARWLRTRAAEISAP